MILLPTKSCHNLVSNLINVKSLTLAKHNLFQNEISDLSFWIWCLKRYMKMKFISLEAHTHRYIWCDNWFVLNS